MKEYDKAVQAYKNAYEISRKIKGVKPDHYPAWALYEIGKAYEMLGSTDKAREYYNKINRKNKKAFKSAQARLKKGRSKKRASVKNPDEIE